MNIKTKFNVSDEVWVIRNNKPYSFRIQSIQMKLDYTALDLYYTAATRPFVPGVSLEWFNEKDCFKSKQALLKSL